MEKSALLVIADISGYTQFMLSNRQSLAHSQMIITGLTQTILSRIELPLEVAKLEGDAVFLYAFRHDDPQSWQEAQRTIGERLFAFFAAFGEKVREYADSNMCGCSACSNVGKLKLKVIVHSGVVLSYQIGAFRELSGVDVILVHKLLKNSVPADEYMLFTEEGRRQVELDPAITLHPGRETVEPLGEVPVLICYPSGEPDGGKPSSAAGTNSPYGSSYYRWKNEAQKIWFSIRTFFTR
ncbi:DUF2652 domain-containing protein [Paenibacillus athensensis]|nr:DUF2652 domain-containing protein [Paenibacillus athensensis]MCD1260482.1 DUF2652 domain-containing protein [Paenibacillus athensensis]